MTEQNKLPRVIIPVTGTIVVRDFDMPFGSMVGFMIKWAIAAIPAFIVLAVIGGIGSIFFVMFLAVIGRAQ
jgi:hypothetical protein